MTADEKDGQFFKFREDDLLNYLFPFSLIHQSIDFIHVLLNKDFVFALNPFHICLYSVHCLPVGRSYGGQPSLLSLDDKPINYSARVTLEVQ